MPSRTAESYNLLNISVLFRFAMCFHIPNISYPYQRTSHLAWRSRNTQAKGMGNNLPHIVFAHPFLCQFHPTPSSFSPFFFSFSNFILRLLPFFLEGNREREIGEVRNCVCAQCCYTGSWYLIQELLLRFLHVLSLWYLVWELALGKSAILTLSSHL